MSYCTIWKDLIQWLIQGVLATGWRLLIGSQTSLHACWRIVSTFSTHVAYHSFHVYPLSPLACSIVCIFTRWLTLNLVSYFLEKLEKDTSVSEKWLCAHSALLEKLIGTHMTDSNNWVETFKRADNHEPNKMQQTCSHGAVSPGSCLERDYRHTLTRNCSSTLSMRSYVINHKIQIFFRSQPNTTLLIPA